MSFSVNNAKLIAIHVLSVEDHHHHGHHHLSSQHDLDDVEQPVIRRPDRIRVHSSRHIVVDGKLVLKDKLEQIRKGSGLSRTSKRSVASIGKEESLLNTLITKKKNSTASAKSDHSAKSRRSRHLSGESYIPPKKTNSLKRWFKDVFCSAFSSPSVYKKGYFRLEPNYPTLCPRCNKGTFEAKWTPISIYCCLFVPVLGILCCLAFREYRCTECDEVRCRVFKVKPPVFANNE